MTAIAERVAAGAAFLDEHDPGWDRDVDLATLDLSDCGNCVFGQLQDGYDDGLIEFGLSDQRATELGFAEAGFLNSDCDYPALTAEWRKIITARREAAS